jgi:hypothetical protein
MNDSRISPANVALLLAVGAVIGVYLVAVPPLRTAGYLLACGGPVAVVLGGVERYRTDERAAFWAVVVGFFASAYLPTFFAFRTT